MPENINRESGGSIPIGITNFVDNRWVGADQKYSPADALHKTGGIKLESNHRLPVEFTNVAIYPPTNYLPQALVIGFGRLFTDKVVVMFYLARLANIIFLSLALAIAIHWLPYGKRALLAIGLLPVVVGLGASLSADILVLGSAALYTAYLLRLICQKTTVLPKQWLFITLLASLVVLSKQTYFILVLTLLALPLSKKQVRDKRNEWLRAFGALGVSLLPLALWLILLGNLNTQPHHLQAAVNVYPNPSEQISFMVHKPLAMLKVLIASLSNNSLMYSFIGVLGISDIPLPSFIYFLIALMLFLSFGQNGLKQENIFRKRSTSLLFVLVALLSIGLVLAGLYVYWTTPYHDVISGMQSRYFLPAFILATPVLYGRFRHTISDKIIQIGLIVGLVFTVFALIARFYTLSFV